jgi:hypothetical protein
MSVERCEAGDCRLAWRLQKLIVRSLTFVRDDRNGRAPCRRDGSGSGRRGPSHIPELERREMNRRVFIKFDLLSAHAPNDSPATL